MKDQLITFETAKLAKEKGFDFSNVEIRDSNTLLVVNNIKERLKYFNNINDANLIQLPTQSLLQKWLREEHQLHIEIYVQLGFKHYSFSILPKAIKSLINFTTYEKALEKGLQKALKLKIMEEEDLKTYIFCHKNSSIVITISSICFDNAEMELYDLGIDTEEFRCDDKEGEKE